MIDLAVGCRALIVGDSTITDELPAFLDSYPVFTQRPVDERADFPLIIISPNITPGIESDLIDRTLRTITRDISIYGLREPSEKYVQVETIAFRVWQLFNRMVVTSFTMPSGWDLVQSVAFGPIVAPTDDEKQVGRIVTVQFTVTPSN